MQNSVYVGGGGGIWGVSIGNLCTPQQAWEKGRVGVGINPGPTGALEVETSRTAMVQVQLPASRRKMENLTPGLMAKALVRWIWIRISVLRPKKLPGTLGKFPGLSEAASASIY